jgi:glycerol-3-phosphate dehydrogenase
LLGDARTRGDLGQDFGEGLFEAEIRYLAKYEWATEAEDVLFRRTKLGVRMRPDQIEAVGNWMKGVGDLHDTASRDFVDATH